MYGELVPVGGGDPIPLLKKSLTIGRIESCDIVLRFPNVSSKHCHLTCESGYWYVTDLDSRNGTKVNDHRVLRKRLDPGDSLSVAKHKYEVKYSPVDIGAIGPPPPDEDEVGQIMGASLLQKAGLQRRPGAGGAGGATDPRRFDVRDNRAGQMKRPDPRDDE